MKTKPYPWKCPECRAKSVHPVHEPYQTDIEHDGRSYRIQVPSLGLHRCSACGFTIMDDVANKAISAASRREAGLLTPEDIRAERDNLELTQKQLAGHLRIAEATLSRWETGVQIQQRAMDVFLRAYFALPELRTHLGGETRCDKGRVDLDAMRTDLVPPSHA